MDCGATCLKMIAKHYGRFYSLAFLRNLCGTTREGVSILNIIHGAERIGLKARAVKVSLKQLVENVPLPCIAYWRQNHFVVIYKISAKKIYLSDPAKGLISYEHKVFAKNWYQPDTKKGVLIGLEPETNFHDIHHDDDAKSNRSFGSILRYFAPYKSNITNLMIIMLLVTGLQATLPFLTRAIIDVGIGTSDLNFINMMLIANVCILLATTFSNAVRDWIILHLTSRVNISLISDYLVKLMRLPITFFENKMIGDILQRASDHQRVREFIMGNSLNLIFSTLTFIVFAIILGIFNKLIFLIFAAGSLLYFLWVLAFLAIRKRLDTNYFSLMAQDQSYWVETISSMQDIKTNNYENAKRWKWENLQARLYKVNLKLTSITNYQNQGGQFIQGFKNVLITIFCAKAVISGDMTFGVMISTQIIIGMLNAPIQQFIQFIISAQSAKISLMRINEIHQLNDEETLESFNDILLPEKKNILIKGVYFQYAPKTPPVIRDLRLKIPEKKVTAIVGSSGSGKSTLLKLILRLYEPSDGEISIGNLNIKNIPLHYWRSKCGVVLQDGKIFSDTILNNIVLGDEHIDFDKFRKAVAVANIAGEIESMPKGYDTKTGEDGRGLSGGQKQRILITRALYKDPEFLFLDEATNSLDTINERKIVEALQQSFIGRTVVVVAHRLSTVKDADQIVVMRDGRVIEIGTHESLMAKNGYYCELVTTQTAFA
ncbi:peptidase domain-containing ABC transporter [Sphingobacterium phlebotomi]|uniref:Peptidase domain-containing ABC transporter n=2 Tax=Sphingobacterium phlebotomi TaxID=2605433 RepID=A0A5D4GSA8_9SPHI|nr:peptidase domain-containing ABC transporter [Sphingobacterium phlebotomi]